MQKTIRQFIVRFGSLALLIALFCLPQATAKPSHTIRFVSVENNVSLEVIDWGGSGRSLVLLAGGGDTAHVFDNFAPKLTATFHVYGITRRGFGESGFSAEGYGADRLGDDVLTVLDSLKLNRPVLVGHSLAGEELSSVANKQPGRIAGLVYLDAAYSYAFDNGNVPSMDQIQEIKGPQPPRPDDSDLASFAALQQYYLRVLGFTYPEDELRQQWTTKIPVPALVIFAIPHGQGTWVDDSTDPKVREAAKAYTAALTPLTETQANAIENGVPTAHVVRIPNAHHYVYLSNEADVLREMRGFIRGLR